MLMYLSLLFLSISLSLSLARSCSPLCVLWVQDGKGGIQLGDFLLKMDNMMGNKTQTKKMKISECRPILEDMEADRLINSGACVFLCIYFYFLFFGVCVIFFLDVCAYVMYSNVLFLQPVCVCVCCFRLVQL